MSSYIPSNNIEMLPYNAVLINEKYKIKGALIEIDDTLLIYEFKPFSEYDVDEEKDCVNDIAIFLSSKLKTLYGNIYATSSHYDVDEESWIIQFDLVKNTK